jgi:acyl-coenzyme A synthetase/AMP-(fatty) acid ligase
VLVAVPRAGFEASETLGEEVCRYIAARLGSSLRPERVVWTEALPVTRSGKVLRGLIRRILAGEDAGSVASVANPDALEALARVAARPN